MRPPQWPHPLIFGPDLAMGERGASYTRCPLKRNRGLAHTYPNHAISRPTRAAAAGGHFGAGQAPPSEGGPPTAGEHPYKEREAPYVRSLSVVRKTGRKARQALPSPVLMRRIMSDPDGLSLGE